MQVLMPIALYLDSFLACIYTIQILPLKVQLIPVLQ